MKGVTKTLNQLANGKIDPVEATKRLYHIKRNGDNKEFKDAIKAYTAKHGHNATEQLYKVICDSSWDEWVATQKAKELSDI